MYRTTFIGLLASTATTATLLWDGRLNNYSDASFLDDWSWEDAKGPYQYYIHGSGPRKDYVSMSKDFKNPADSGSRQGLRISVDETSSWNGQEMMRTELIPSTDSAINEGSVFYHFSLSYGEGNPPSSEIEHQLAFFESHFTEIKYGISGAGKQLHWFANSESQWNATLEAGHWHNMAYEIDFAKGSVTFWHSSAGQNLKKVAGPVKVDAVSNGQDWHVGVLRMAGGKGKEDWYFSGVYIENGELTKAFGGPSR